MNGHVLVAGVDERMTVVCSGYAHLSTIKSLTELCGGGGVCYSMRAGGTP